jgi:hypothetical protein
MTGVGLGWLQGTVKRADPERVLALLAGTIGSEAEGRFGGTRWYSESATIGPHALAAWAPRNRPEAVETYFEVRQSALDELGGAAALRLATELQGAGGRMSRVDGYYDDRTRHAEPAEVADAFRRGDALTHIRRIREIGEFVSSTHDGGAIPDGATTYLGSGMNRVGRSGCRARAPASLTQRAGSVARSRRRLAGTESLIGHTWWRF